jgi:hypothetical protein
MISPGKAFPCTSISVRLYHILKHQESTASFEYYFQSMWKCEFFILSQKTYLQSSVADPDPSDPYAFGPPGSGSGSIPKCHGSATLLQRSNCLGGTFHVFSVCDEYIGLNFCILYR